MSQGHQDDGDRIVRRPYILCLICVHSFGALVKAVRLFMASAHSQKMSYQTHSSEIGVDLQPFGCKLKVGLFDHRFGDEAEVGARYLGAVVTTVCTTW